VAPCPDAQRRRRKSYGLRIEDRGLRLVHLPSSILYLQEDYMVAISIMIEGQDGLTWPRWKRLVAEVEALGFAGLYRSDHFTNAGPPDKDSLEMVVSLTYLADHTQRIHFGPMVAPLSFRNPTLLARQ